MHIDLTDTAQAECLSLLGDPKLGRLEHCCAAIGADGDNFTYREQDGQGYAWLHVCNRTQRDCRRLPWQRDEVLQDLAP